MFEKSRNRPSSADHDELVSAFLSVRRAVGLAGLSLPILLLIHAALPPAGGMQPSISEFYHTIMGDLLVGILVAIGLFLIAYVGHKRRPWEILSDWWVSTIAGISVIGVALFPARHPQNNCMPPEPPNDVQGVTIHWCTGWEKIHFLSAAVFFICMALFCFILFPTKKSGEKSQKREVGWFDEAGNTVYFICGVLISFALAGLAFVFVQPEGSTLAGKLAGLNAVFWLESLGVFAFAIAWLTKGNLLGGVLNYVSRRSDRADR